MMFICSVKIKNMSADQIKTTFSFWFNAARYNMPSTSVKVMLCDIWIERHVNKQKDQ